MTDLGPLIKNYLARRKAGGGALDDLPDVGDPLVGDGGEFSPGTRWGNKAAEIAGKLTAGTAHGLITLPRRAIENSQSSLDTGTYDPSAPMEAALLTLGAGAGARGGQRPVSPALDRPAEPAYIPTHAPEPAQAAAAEASGDVGGGLAGAPGGGEGLQQANLQAERRASGRQPLPGLPTKAQQVDGDLFTPGPVGSVHDVAERYMADKNFGTTHPDKYHPIDKEHATAIAKAYDEMKHAPDDPAVKASYEAMIRETLAQYRAIKESGLQITPVGATDYPYHGNPRAVAKDVADNNHMAFFRTSDGFGVGEKADPTHPLLRPSGEKIGEHELLNNDLFRIVHDYFGHIKHGHGFRAAGEDNAFRTHAAMYSDLARPAMTTETRGQNSWLNYGPHGEFNRTANALDTIYAPQKVGLMPAWTMVDRVKPFAAGGRIKRYAEGGAVDDDVDWSNYNKPTGELKPATYRPTQRVGNAISDALRSAGMPSYTAGDLTSRVGNVVSASPLGIAGSAMDAVDAKARRDDAGTVTAMAGMIPGAKPLQGAVRLVNAEGLATHSKDYMRAARAALDDIAGGPKGAGPLDLSSMNEIPNVPQVAMDRYVPPRGVSPRLKEALEDKSVSRGIAKSIEAGRAVGADKWYHNEPIRRSFVEELGPEQGQKAFSTYMDMVSATSPRSEVPANIRNASYYYQHALEGKPLPEKLPYPYGHIAQNLHRSNFETLMRPRAGELSAGAPATGTAWDIYKNPKPASFSQNLQGNLEPGTMDTHAFRNIAMRSGDPRFLETAISDVLKPGQTLGPETLAGKYGEVTGNKLVYRPQKLVESGKLTMEEAKKIPSFWASKPNENEYAAAEQLYRKLGAKAGLPTADAQAAAWSGAGKLTGLGSPPTHTFPELFNERVLFTSKMRGEDAKKTLRDFITGKKPLLSIAGAAAAGSTLAGQHQEKYARGGRTRYAEGGAAGDDYNTPVDNEPAYQAWKALNAPNDSGVDYDLRGAYLANMQRAENGHMGDRFKKPNHPTFSDQSQYAVGDQRDRAGYWIGDIFVPPAMRASGGRTRYAEGGEVDDAPVFDPAKLAAIKVKPTAAPVFDPAKLAAVKAKSTDAPDEGWTSYLPAAVRDVPKEVFNVYDKSIRGIGNEWSAMRERHAKQAERDRGPDGGFFDPRAVLGQVQDVAGVGSDIAGAAMMHPYVAGTVGAVRSLIGHPMADLEHAAGNIINPDVAAKDDPAKMYETAKGDVDLALSAARPRGYSAKGPLPNPDSALVSPEAEARRAGAKEFDIPISRGQATRDLDRIRYEDMAARGAYGKEAQDRAAAFFEEQYAAMQRGVRQVGEQFAHGEQPLGSPADAGAALNTEIADRATSAQAMRDAVVARGEQAAAAERQRVAEQGRALDEQIGGGDVLPRDAGEIVNQNVRQAAADNRNEFRGHYAEFGRLPGEFDASAVRGMGNRIRNELTYGDNPVIIDEGTPAASRAVQALDEMSQPRITNRASPHAEPDPNEITAVTLRGVDQMRKRLVGYYQQARSSGNASDMRATRALLNGFDNQIERAITENLFSGDPRALEVLQAARASYARYQRTFSPQGAGDDVGAAMRRIVDRNATPEETANMIIGSGKIGSAGLPVRIADRLEQVLGADSEAWQNIRQAMWQKASRVRNSAGEIDAARSARSIEDFANSSLGRRMFPQEVAAMRTHAQGIRDLDRIIETLPQTGAATQARAIYEEAFGGAQFDGTQRQVFRRMVEGTATPEETAQAMFSIIAGGNPGNAARALQAIERIVGRNSPIMGAIKQGVWQKLTQNPFGMDQQGQQKMMQSINQFLNGKGRTIARQLYSHEDRALMNRFSEVVRSTIIPKYARTNSDTAPALLAAVRKMAASVGSMIGVGVHGGVTGGVEGWAFGKAFDAVAGKVSKGHQTKKLNDTLDDIIPKRARTPEPRIRSATKTLPLSVRGGPDVDFGAALSSMAGRDEDKRKRQASMRNPYAP